MKITILLLFLTCTCFAQQQVVVFGTSGLGQLGKPRDLTEVSNIDGNPYLLAEWREGLVFTDQTSKAVRVPKMNYNVYREQFEYDINGSVFFLDNRVYSRFLLINGKDSLYFRNGMNVQVSGISATAYFMVIFDGKNRWLRKDSKTLVNDPSATYGGSKKKVIQDDRSFYLVTEKNQTISMKLSKKIFVKRFAVNGDELQKYLDDKSLSFDRDSDLKEIFKWLDSRITIN